ncbi:CUB and sushi domain-containing protein 2-like [Branchiostoma floridae x Branchiostoma belcheri]
MTPVSFSLEDGYDLLYIYMGELDTLTLLGRYTGQSIAGEIIATYNMAHLLLTSDESYTDGGFKIQFEAFDLTGFPCPDPGVPTNGYRIGDTFDEWSVVTFGCEDGYMLLGQQNLTCVSGHWNFSPPRCSGRIC